MQKSTKVCHCEERSDVAICNQLGMTNGRVKTLPYTDVPRQKRLPLEGKLSSDSETDEV